MSLTDRDRRTLKKAEELIAVRAATIREFTGQENEASAYVVAFGRAQWELGQLADIIKRLAAEGQS